MKKIFWIISAIIIVVVLVLLNFEWIFYRPCPPPEMPKDVPGNAVWKGACDGGIWMELVSLDSEIVRFRIYRDWDGELILDADFKYEDCKNFHLTESDWADKVAYFENEITFYRSSEIFYDPSNPSRRCRLEPIFPAYGGSLLDILRESKDRD